MRGIIKKIISLLACILALTMVLTSCTNPQKEGPKSTPDAHKQDKALKDTIVFSPRLDFQTMDVQNTPSIVTKSIYYLIYNTLIEKDVETNSLVPALAESWEIVSPTEIVFKLREGVKFHDGSSFTAEDVKYTYERALESNGSASKLTSIENIKCDGDYTLRLTLKQPNMDILDLLTDPSLSILSKTAIESLGEEKGIQQGTGPYKYVEWKQGSHLDLTANEDYWNGVPPTKNLRVHYIAETSSRLIAVETGELDFCQDIPRTEIASVQANKDLQYIVYPSATIDFMAINMNEPPMDNIDVRRAIAYAINRMDIINGVFMGNALELNNLMHSSNAYYSEIAGTDYNPDKAKELLTQAGYGDGLELTIACNTTSDSQTACTIIQALLGEIGITVKIDVMETATLAAKMSAGVGYHLAYSRWSGYSFGPDNGLRQLVYTGGYNNYSHVSDSKLDAMLDEALTIDDHDKRLAAYKEIEEYCDEQMYAYPVLVENYTFVARKGVENILEPNGPIMNFRQVLAYED